MLISPEKAIEEGWVTHPSFSSLEDWKEAKYVSPNGIDFTVDKMFRVDEESAFFIDSSNKKMRSNTEIQPNANPTKSTPGVSYFSVAKGTVHDCISDMYITLPTGVSVLLIHRSVFSRNGLFITSGFYDSGYEGHIGFALHNRGGESYVAPNTRIGQMLFLPSDSELLYAGGWNHSKDEHWMESTNGSPTQ